MNSPGNNPSPYPENRVLVLLLVAAAALVWILLPFYGTIMWGAIVALLFAPLNRRLVPWMNGRRKLAALLTLLIVLIIVVLPLVLVTGALAREAAV